MSASFEASGFGIVYRNRIHDNLETNNYVGFYLPKLAYAS